MTFGKVVAAVIVGIFATALIVHLFSSPCMLSVGGTCFVRGDAPAVAFLRELSAAANRSLWQTNATESAPPVSADPGAECRDFAAVAEERRKYDIATPAEEQALAQRCQ